jgi:Bcr/CflA subfamily drug resistance transporter
VTGFGQLLFGPLSDHFGRYKILLISCFLYFIGALLCAQTNWIIALIVYRVIQGFGACGMFVTAFAIVRDAFYGHVSGMIYSFLNSTISISPILGPIIGVILSNYFPWQGIFYFLSALGGLTIILSIGFVKESLPYNKRKPVNATLLHRYYNIICSLTFWRFVLPATTGIAAFFTLFSMTPYIIQVLNEPKSQIGFYFGLAGVSFLIGSLIAGIIVRYIGVFKTSLAGTLLILLAGMVMLGIHMISGLSLLGFFLPSMIATLGSALTAGPGASGALEPFEAFPGAASAMFGALQLGGSSVIGSIATLFPITSSLPLALTMLIMASISLLCFMLYHVRLLSNGS